MDDVVAGRAFQGWAFGDVRLDIRHHTDTTAGEYTKNHTLHHLNIDLSCNTKFAEHLKSITHFPNSKQGSEITDAVKTQR